MVASAIEGVSAIATMAPHTPSSVVAAPAYPPPRASAPAVITMAPAPPAVSSVPAGNVAPVEEQPDLNQPATGAQATKSSRRPPPAVSAGSPEPPLERLHERDSYPTGATLAQEVSALDEARRALSSGDAESALLALNRYELRVPSPRLGPEATVLRIEALLAERDFDRARQLGEELLAKDPGGAYAQHVRTLLAGSAARSP